jgi:hypothetical protein
MSTAKGEERAFEGVGTAWGDETEGPPGNLHYDLPATLKGGKKEKQDGPE